MTRYRNTVLIFNPRAGRLGPDGGPALARAIQILESDGHRITVVPTTAPRTAGAIAREHIERGADLILAAGGDGTINETAEGMVGSHVPLGILPGGTANVLAMEMKLGWRIEQAAARLGECLARRISVGHVTCDEGRVARHFLLMAGIGLDAHIVYRVNGPLKARTGKLAYWVAGWTMLGWRLAEFQAQMNGGGSRSCSFALLSKVRNYGGDFEIARDTSLFDENFEAVLFQGRSTLRYVKYVVGMTFNRLREMRGVEVLRTDRARLSSPRDERVYIQIDGEFAGRLPADIRIVPDALTLLVPPDYGPAAQATP